MNKTTTLPIILLAGFAPIQSFAANGDNRPNIIVFLTDDQSFTAINALGNDDILTPNINRLVEKGVAFMSNYATTSISMASRAQIMTGMYEYKTGCNFNQNQVALSLDKFKKSYPVILREGGYYTGFAGKFGFLLNKVEEPVNMKGYEKLPVNMFDEWGGGVGQTVYETASNHYIASYADEYPHSSRAYGAYGCDFIDKATESGKPFCLSLSFKAPHRPLTPDPMFDHIYEGKTISLPPNYDPKYSDDILPMQAKLGRQYLSFFDEFGYSTFEGYQESIKNYYQLIYGIDYAIGMVLDKLEREGLDENTIIIFTSDNGYSGGDRRLAGKILPYETASRTPLIIVDPANKKNQGKRVESLTGNIDIAATVLDYAQLPTPECVDGKSLRPLLANTNGSVHKYLNLINTWGAPQTFTLSIVSSNMKYIFWGFADNMDPVEELFDLNRDPYERENVAGVKKYKAKLEEFRAIYDERLAIWAEECVGGNYEKYPTILSRHLDWEERDAAIPTVFKNMYLGLLRSIGYKGDPRDYESVIENRLK